VNAASLPDIDPSRLLNELAEPYGRSADLCGDWWFEIAAHGVVLRRGSVARASEVLPDEPASASADKGGPHLNRFGVILARAEQAMEEQAAAERARRATVTRAEGDKQAQILEAEGRLEASKRDAEAQVILADASRKAIEMVTAAIGDNEMPVVYLLGQKYVDALENLSGSENSKMVVLPADFPAAVKGMMGKA